MASYTFTAQTKDNNTINGHVEAASKEAATQAIIKQGHRPISITEEKTQKSLFSFGGKKVKTTELVVFTRQLSTMISAGVPLLRALNTLTDQAESKAMKSTLADVTKDVQSGMALGDAFAKHPTVFSDVFINMVRAGEAGGILDDILKRLAVQQEKNDSMRKKVKSAMTYPMVLVVIMVGAFFGMMYFVIPNIGKILYDLGGPDAKLPFLTQVMLGLSSWMLQYWYVVFGIVFGIIFALRKFIKTPKGKRLLHYSLIKAPIIGPIIKKVAVARFARTFSSLAGAGVSVLETLRVTGNAIGNEAFKDELGRGAEAIKSGQQLSVALAKGGLFPGIVPQMLAVGEETGQTAEILIKIADFYEEEVDATISSISSIIEPVMIVLMGGLVGLVAVSVMEPIASLSQSIK